MCIWIIRDQMSWFHCLRCTSGWYPLPSHYHCNCICRIPHYFCLIYPQWLSEYHYNQSLIKSLSKFTTSIPRMFQKKMAKASISFNKPKGHMHSRNKINPKKYPAGKLWYDLLKPIFVTLKIIKISSIHYFL